MRFKPSVIIHDLHDLKARFQHVDESTIKQKYVQIFRKLAKGASCKTFLQLLAKRYAREQLENEYPLPGPVAEKADGKRPGQIAEKKQLGMKVSAFFGKLLRHEGPAAGNQLS